MALVMCVCARTHREGGELQFILELLCELYGAIVV